MWPRAVFYTKALNEENGRKQNLGRQLDFLQRGGVYVLYRDDVPCYVGKAQKLRRRLHHWATNPRSKNFRFWNYFSAFVIDDSTLRNVIEAVLIAALPTADNGARPKLKNAKMPPEVARLLRLAYGGTSHQVSPDI